MEAGAFRSDWAHPLTRSGTMKRLFATCLFAAGPYGLTLLAGQPATAPSQFVPSSATLARKTGPLLGGRHQRSWRERRRAEGGPSASAVLHSWRCRAARLGS